jgi:hypothetical protein
MPPRTLLVGEESYRYAMLRRILLALIVWGLASGFAPSADGLDMIPDCAQSADAGAPAVDCSDADVCGSTCHSGACIASDALSVGAALGSSLLALPVHGCARLRAAPETDPPKFPLL